MNKKNRYTMYCIAGDKRESVTVKLISNVRLREMSPNDIQELVERFAEENRVWKDILKGKGRAIIYDVETYENVRYIDGTFEWVLE